MPCGRSLSSMVKVIPWQCPRSFLRLARLAALGSLATPSHCLGCSSYPPLKLPISPPLTIQAQTRTGAKTLAELGMGTLISGCVTTSCFAFLVGAIQFSIFGTLQHTALGALGASTVGALGLMPG